MRFAVIGSPIAHSKSPKMHAAAYASLGLAHTYEALETSAEDLPLRLDALRAGELAGINVTVPHKQRALALADVADANARTTGAANTLVRLPTGVIRAHNTDAPAFHDELVALATLDHFRGRTAIVLGTGGAARAAIFALGQLGVAKVIVRGRRVDPDLAKMIEDASSRTMLVQEPIDQPSTPGDLAVIVQATTAGMVGGAPGEVAASAIDWAGVPPDAVVYDIVYAPKPTAFLVAAGKRRRSGGLGMLARQGALAFELWLGVPAPLDAMRAAL